MPKRVSHSLEVDGFAQVFESCLAFLDSALLEHFPAMRHDGSGRAEEQRLSGKLKVPSLDNFRYEYSGRHVQSVSVYEGTMQAFLQERTCRPRRREPVSHVESQNGLPTGSVVLLGGRFLVARHNSGEKHGYLSRWMHPGLVRVPDGFVLKSLLLDQGGVRVLFSGKPYEVR